MPDRMWRKQVAAIGVFALLGVAGCGNDDGDAASADGYCDEMEAAIAQTSFDVSDPDYDFDVIVDLFRTVEAPEEIREDWNLNRDAILALSEMDPDDPDAFDDMEPIDFDELDAATRRIEAYTLDECDIDLT